MIQTQLHIWIIQGIFPENFPTKRKFPNFSLTSIPDFQAIGNAAHGTGGGQTLYLVVAPGPAV